MRGLGVEDESFTLHEPLTDTHHVFTTYGVVEWITNNGGESAIQRVVEFLTVCPDGKTVRELFIDIAKGSIDLSSDPDFKSK
tara:strand:- start:85 stop:330 length:246 start_codon:yes stop_codon:yes gene_type:complete